jgi:hypothetical protein
MRVKPKPAWTGGAIGMLRRTHTVECMHSRWYEDIEYASNRIRAAVWSLHSACICAVVVHQLCMAVVQSCMPVRQSCNAVIHGLDSGFLLFSLSSAFPVHGLYPA